MSANEMCMGRHDKRSVASTYISKSIRVLKIRHKVKIKDRIKATKNVHTWLMSIEG